MAIVKKPLLSGDARGKIGDSLVFIGWKGIKTVRSHVVPANPRTQSQITQRSYMTNALDAWKNSLFSSQDQDGLRNAASLQSKPMSGFNFFVKKAVDLQVAGNTLDDSENSQIYLVRFMSSGWDVNNFKINLQSQCNYPVNALLGFTPRQLTFRVPVSVSPEQTPIGRYRYDYTISIPAANIPGGTGYVYFTLEDDVNNNYYPLVGIVPVEYQH